MNIYYTRCVPADFELLVTLGEKLGAIVRRAGDVDADGAPIIRALGGGSWDYIGEIHRPTGAVDSGGHSIYAPITDPAGVPYLHANLATPVALHAAATELASTDPDVAAALADLGRFFLLDAEGNARLPDHPHRVFAGA